MYNTKEGQGTAQITSITTQVSILGPDLWDSSYHSMFEVGMPEDIGSSGIPFRIGNVDDVAATNLAKDEELAQYKLNKVAGKVSPFMKDHRLSWTTKKIETVGFTKTWIPTRPQINLSGNSIKLRCSKISWSVGGQVTLRPN